MTPVFTARAHGSVCGPTCTSACIFRQRCWLAARRDIRLWMGGCEGDAENAGLENAGLENAGTSCVWVAKCNIINVRGHVRANVTAGRGDPCTLQEAIQSGN